VFDVIGKRKWFFLFSGLVVIPGFIFILLTPLTNGKVGLQFSIDYTGGTVWQFTFKNPDASIDEVRTVIRDTLAADGLSTEFSLTKDTANQFTFSSKEPNLVPVPTLPPTLPPAEASASASAEAQAYASASASVVASAQASAQASASASAQASAMASAGITPAPTASPSATPTPSPSPSPTPAVLNNSTNQNGKPCSLSVPTTGELGKLAAALQANPNLGPLTCTGLENTVGAVVSEQLIQQAVLLILLGSVGILTWITIRFWAVGGFKYGVTALAALVHDVIVVVGLFAIMGTLFGVQIDALFVTAMLTVIGFSVHDTIVVYDRIRENKTRHAGEPFDAIVNHSILQTFGRSINTSLTVVITLTALLLFSGGTIHYFVLALLIGIISGTYSSIFNASPLLVVWQLWEDNRKAQRLAALRARR
jgi:preprotein translocase SecF subunit